MTGGYEPAASYGEETSRMRPGPLPPRLEPSGGSSTSSPVGPAPGHPPAQWGPPPASVPPAPAGGYSAGPALPPVGATAPATAASGAPFGPGGVPPAPHRRRAWPGIAALVLALVLAVASGVQAYQINVLNGRLRDTDRRLAEAQAADAARLDTLDGRTAQLEEQAGKAFDPEAVAAEVLPSVFRVSAGDLTGTAFAVGGPATGGGTNLFTNFHVVEPVWSAGQREVFLERRDERFFATVVGVDEAHDVALLTTKSKFTGLTAASETVKSGQQIVVIGSPLGLDDSVTVGAVSAFRDLQDGAGTVIQFDAAINPGNSGGPVVNATKEVVGIAKAKARDAEGIGLAVPVKTACDRFGVC